MNYCEIVCAIMNKTPSFYCRRPNASLFATLVLWCFCPKIMIASDDSRIVQLIKQLASEKYSVREYATEELIDLGPKTISLLVKNWQNCDSPECRMRILKVLQSVIPKIDFKENSDEIQLLKELRDSSHSSLAKLAKNFVGATPEPELAKLLQTAINKVVSDTERTIPMSNELWNKIANSSAFQVVRRPPIRNQNRNSHWRTINDKDAHQEILMYRIRWFNGSWSSWMLPGVNDQHHKLDRQHWNCFYDHHHEYVQIMTKIGDRTKRSDYLRQIKK